MMASFLDSKLIKGLVDTGVDTTIISLNDAKTCPHWRFKDSPTITGLGCDSTSKTTILPIHWKDLDSNQGRFYHIVSDALCTLWGQKLLKENVTTISFNCTFYMLSACYSSGEAPRTILVLIPAFVLALVSNVTHFHKVELMSPTRIKRDFRIITAITATTLLVIAGGAVATTFLIQTWATANVLNMS